MLYVAPVPIGNLEDVTVRSRRLFQEAEFIICEDSRQTRKLLNLLNIDNKPKFIDITKNHQFNLKKIEDCLLGVKETDATALVVSDAGTPGISDPGREVINIAQRLEVSYTVLPGSTSFVPALVASGFVKKEFLFLGFLPVKKGRNKEWTNIIRSQYPIAIYESVHRMEKFLEECTINLEPNRKICICNDISKMHESIWIGEVMGLATYKLIKKGEYVVIINSA